MFEMRFIRDSKIPDKLLNNKKLIFVLEGEILLTKN